MNHQQAVDIKTVAVGVGGVGVTFANELELWLRIMVAAATLIYVCMQIYSHAKKTDRRGRK